MKFDLERLYQLYPRKIGKTVGMKKAVRDVKSEQDYADLEAAIRRFTAHLRASGTEPQYIPYFQTFMTSWRDWLDPETGQVKLSQAPQPPILKNVYDLVGALSEQEEEWGDPKRVREILDKAMRRKSVYVGVDGKTESQEGLAGDLEEAGPDDCD